MRFLVAVVSVASFGCGDSSEPKIDAGVEPLPLSCPEPSTRLAGEECQDLAGAECLSDSECGLFDECRSNICVRVDSDLGFELVADFPPELPVNHADEVPVSFGGWGGAVFDGDGDGRLEILAGGAVGQAQILNDQLVIHPSLTLPVELQGADILVGQAIDADGDLDHELFVAGVGTLGVIDWTVDGPSYTDLVEQLPGGGAGYSFGSMLPADLDDDGDLDLYVGPVVVARGRFDLAAQALESPPKRNFFFRRESDGEWVMDESLSELDQASTLAVNHVDWNDDGALDLVLINDRPVGDGAANPFVQDVLGPGAVLAWTPRGYERFPMWGDTDTNYGSWMAGTELFYSGTRYFYMSDIAMNALVDLDSDPPTRVREPRALVEFGPEGEPLGRLFGWGVVASDFDRNGYQDVFFVRGLVSAQVAPDLPIAAGTLELQTDLAWVVGDDGEIVQTHQLSPSVQGGDGWSFQGRGAIVLDLDLDGEQDLIEFGVFFDEVEPLWRAGFLRYRVRSENHGRTPPVCTLIPRPWLVPATVGYGIREVGTDFFRTENSGGQVRLGSSPWPVSTYGAGTLRFASGAQVAFDCRGTAGPLVIEEPVGWLDVSSSDGLTRVCVDAEAWGREPASVTLLLADSERQMEVDGGCWVGPNPSSVFYVMIDQRTVTYRFE